MAADLQNLSDEELARQTQAGSLEAFEALVYRYERRLYSFLLHCCRDETLAREVTQDSFVRAFQAIAQYDPRRSFAPWLFTIGRRKYIDRRRAPVPLLSGLLPSEIADEGDPFELLARQEEQEGLWQLAREVLPGVQFQALWLRYAEEMSVAAIGQVLSKTQTHVKVLLFRAREALGRRIRAVRVVPPPAPPVARERTIVLAKPVAGCTPSVVPRGLL